MVYALLLTLAALPAKPAPRPDAPAAPPVAQVLFRHGAVTIRSASGTEFVADDGVPLQLTDTVIVKVAAWVALALVDNQQVVRLDEDLELKVSELALLKAPKRSDPLSAQLDALFTSGEREGRQRLIGWNASQTAANTPAARRESESSPSGGGPKILESVDDAPEPTSPPPTPRPAPTPPPPAERQAQPKPERPAQSPKDSARTKQRVQVIPLAADDALRECLEGALTDLGPEVRKSQGAGVVVRARLRGDRLMVSLPSGLPTPSCAVEWFKARPVTAEWTRLTVPLR